MIKNINVREFLEMIKNNHEEVEIIDVREKDEYEIIHLKDSKLIPMIGVANRADEIDWNKKVIFVCRSGARSGYIAQTFANQYDVCNLTGGIHNCYHNNECKQYLVVNEDKVSNYFARLEDL